MKKKLLDAIERTVATAAETFLAAVAVGSVTNLHAAAIAGVASAIAAAKYAVIVLNAYLGNPPA